MRNVLHIQARGVHRCWGIVVLAVVLWHGQYTARTLGADYLFSLCYFSNVLLAAGLMLRSALLIAVGFGWTLIGLPLWVADVIVTKTFVFSSLAFHTVGLCLGFVSARHMLFPRWLVCVALPAGLFSCLLARLFTDPHCNVNAVFRVQQGWEWLFPNFLISYLAQNIVYALCFWLLPWVSNRFIYEGEPA